MESCDFSSDIIYEILTRSSMETVGRCRLLSKERNSITYDSVFTNLHGQRTNTMSGYFMQSMMSNIFYSSFVSMDDWRSYPKLSLNFLPDRVETQASTNQDSEDNKGKDIELVEYMGKLAITCIGKDESFIELWVLENYGKKEWNKRYKINIEAFKKEPYTRPVAFYNADIVLMKEYDHRVTFFNFKNGSIERLSLENKLNHGCFRFQSDFEPSDLTGGFALKHPQGTRTFVPVVSPETSSVRSSNALKRGCCSKSNLDHISFAVFTYINLTLSMVLDIVQNQRDKQ
ncbi:hypothetical protein DKX38_001972 [Salix brachista]|uniref:F-box associated beta-propeller type 3 domain-containing protein n=1 Tax=Salix brachista TaxID=2182728 RepID=A0A5N5NLV5_9ROSI|nr:hypothetical protein DKX38_001972 [Salix brachista]